MVNLHHNFQVKQSPGRKILFVTLDRVTKVQYSLPANVFTFTEFASIPAYVLIDYSDSINNKKCGVSFIIVGFLKSLGLPFDMMYTMAMVLWQILFLILWQIHLFQLPFLGSLVCHYQCFLGFIGYSSWLLEYKAIKA